VIYYVPSTRVHAPLFREIAVKQIRFFNKTLKGPLNNHTNHSFNYFVTKNSFSTFLKTYSTENNFNTICIRVVEIDPEVYKYLSVDYYKIQANNLHLLFYAFDSNKEEFIDNQAYDLNESVAGYGILPIEKTVEDLFIKKFKATNGCAEILDKINPLYMLNPTKNTRYIFVDKNELEKSLLYNNSKFDRFHIRLSLIYNWPTCSEPKLRDRDKLLNFLFYRADKYNRDLRNDTIFDMNELCPPGNCFDQPY
jgi:hypothetical protein